MSELERMAVAIREAALTAKGTTSESFRRDVYEHALCVARERPTPARLQPELASFVQAVTMHSNDVDLDTLSKNGLSDDTIFEAAVVAAVAAGLVRMEEGLRALRAK